MKTLIAIVILLLISQLSFAQKNFEGRIVYKYSGGPLEAGTTEICFGNQKIKITEFPVEKSSYSDKRITDFTKGVEYKVNDSSKTYYKFLLNGKSIDGRTKSKFDSLTELKPYPAKNKRIMGYNCTAYILGNIVEATPEMRMPRMAIYMWYADSLFYIIDKKYKNATDIEKATNGKNVGMGMEISIGEDSSLEKIIAEPVSIVAETIPDSLFLVQSGYTLKTDKYFIESKTSSKTLEMTDVQLAEVKKVESSPPPSIMPNIDSAMIAAARAAVDSVVRIVDSIVKEAEKKQNKKKNQTNKSPSKNTHTQSTKSPAQKPKE